MLNNSQLHHQLFFIILRSCQGEKAEVFTASGLLITLLVFFHSYLFSPSRRWAGGLWWIHDNSWAQAGVVGRSWWFPWKYDRQHLLAGKWDVHIRFSLEVPCLLGWADFDSEALSVSSDWSELFWSGVMGALWIRCLSWRLRHSQFGLREVCCLLTSFPWSRESLNLREWSSSMSNSWEALSWGTLKRGHWCYLWKFFL